MAARRPLARLALVACAALVVGLTVVSPRLPPAAAQDADAFGAAFRRAEIRERALGDLAAASELYLAAAREAPGPTERARAELRAAACLIRLGRGAEAETLAATWASAEATGVALDVRARARELLASSRAARPEPADVDAPPSEAAIDPAGVALLKDERDQLRLRLERSLGETAGARQESESLAAALAAKQRELEELEERQAKLRPAEPETAEEALRQRREQLERQRREDRANAAVWTRYAAQLHRDGRFAEAREILYDAILRDPENVEAKALLARVEAPLGDRERLHLRIKEVLALVREVRLARITSEAEFSLQQGRRLQERGEMASSVAPLERALAALTAPGVALRVRGDARSEAELLLRRAEAAGMARAPVRAPSPEALPEPWVAALRDMLSTAGAEIKQGLDLRFHDLDALLPVASVPLPPVPVSEPPAGWTLSTQVADAPDLLAAWLRGAERSGLAVPGATLDVEGSTIVALADDATQERLTARLATAGLTGSEGVDVEVVVLRMAPGAWGERLAARGLGVREIPGGARASEPPPLDLAALLDDVGGGVEVLARGTFRATHLSPFRLAGGSTARAISVDVLAVAGDEPGLALDIATRWRPTGRGDSAEFRQRSLVGAAVAAGGGVAVHAISDPAAPGRDLVVVARIGRRAGASPTAAVARPELPDVPSGLRAAEHLLPRSIARPEEIAATLLPLPDAPVPTRRSALEARLRQVASGATTLEIRGDRVLVVGPASAHDGVRAFFDRVAGVRELQRFRVEAYVLPRDAEADLVRALPGMTRTVGGQASSIVTSDGRALASARRILASGARRVPLTEDVLATPPTLRHDAAHVVRTPFRVDLDTAPGEESAWGRAETGVVDQGFLLALRPFGRDARGRDDLDVALRLVRVTAVTERERETPLGDVDLLEPVTQTIAADLRAELGPRDVLVIASLPSPYSRDDDIRFALVVTPLR